MMMFGWDDDENENEGKNERLTGSLARLDADCVCQIIFCCYIYFTSFSLLTWCCLIYFLLISLSPVPLLNSIIIFFPYFKITVHAMIIFIIVKNWETVSPSKRILFKLLMIVFTTFLLFLTLISFCLMFWWWSLDSLTHTQLPFWMVLRTLIIISHTMMILMVNHYVLLLPDWLTDACSKCWWWWW